MKWSKAELEGLWALENPGNGNPHLMAAIALAESAGDDQNTNSIGACGLWQIHPFETGCLNPYTNARQAGRKLRSQGLGAWESYTNGSYRQFLTGSQMTPVSGTGSNKNVLFGIPGTPEIPGESVIPNPVEAVPGLGPVMKLLELPAKFTKQILSFFKLFFSEEGWIRIGKVLLGAFLLLSGILGMAKVNAGEKVVGAGHKALDVAAIAE